MRRSSVIGPLLLIAIGLLFLVHNVVPEIPVIQIVSQYWPFILILWGGLRMIEILFWAMSGRPLPRSGISGGEWVFVIFLCLIGSSLYTSRHYAGSWNVRSLRAIATSMGESFDYNIDASGQASGKTPHIVVENFRGNARIVGDDGDQVKVTGRKTVRAFQQSEADKANTETPVEVLVEGDEITIRANQDKVSDSLRVEDDLEIKIPRRASLEAHGKDGDFDIRDLQGNVDLTSDHSGVRIDSIGGNVRVEVHKSDIVRATAIKGFVELKGKGQDVDFQDIGGQVTVDGDFLGQVEMRNLAKPSRFNGAHIDLQFEKLPGQLHMGLGDFRADNIGGPIHLNSKARDVVITDFTQSLALTLDRGDIELKPGNTGPLPKMDVRTRSGDIDLALPDNAKFELKMVADHGEAHNEYGTPLVVEEQERGASIAGSVGTGPELHLQSERGTITVRKGSDNSEKPEKAEKSEKEEELKVEKQ
jgi:DUF4097 and DUF4098 domain-containing protein YvlB